MNEAITLNTFDANMNLFSKGNETEYLINLVLQEGEEKLIKDKNVIYALSSALERSREVWFENHDLFQGMLYRLMGTYYQRWGKLEEAAQYLEHAYDLLYNYNMFKDEITERLLYIKELQKIPA